jgi:hypothetical protein
MELIIDNNTDKELIARIDVEFDGQVLREGSNTTANRLDFKNIKYISVTILESD